MPESYRARQFFRTTTGLEFAPIGGWYGSLEIRENGVCSVGREDANAMPYIEAPAVQIQFRRLVPPVWFRSPRLSPMLALALPYGGSVMIDFARVYLKEANPFAKFMRVITSGALKDGAADRERFAALLEAAGGRAA